MNLHDNPIQCSYESVSWLINNDDYKSRILNPQCANINKIYLYNIKQDDLKNMLVCPNREEIFNCYCYKKEISCDDRAFNMSNVIFPPINNVDELFVANTNFDSINLVNLNFKNISLYANRKLKKVINIPSNLYSFVLEESGL